MDIGIISDIHGDYVALEETLERLDNVHHVEHVLCAGDLIGRGPSPKRVIDLIRGREIPTVLGNHDEFMHNLPQDYRAYLRELPVDWQADMNGRRLYMCHGKPGNNIWGLYRDHTSNTLLDMMLASLNAEVLITGHTHVPLYVRVERGCVVNPGSIYTFESMRPTSHSYGVLHLDDLTFDLYDVQARSVKTIPYEQ